MGGDAGMFGCACVCVTVADIDMNCMDGLCTSVRERFFLHFGEFTGINTIDLLVSLLLCIYPNIKQIKKESDSGVLRFYFSIFPP